MTFRWSNGKMKVQRKNSKRKRTNSIGRNSTFFSALYVCCYFLISNPMKFARGNGKSCSSSLSIHPTNRFDGSTDFLFFHILLHRSVLGYRFSVSPLSRRCHWINSLCTDLRFHPQRFSSLLQKTKIVPFEMVRSYFEGFTNWSDRNESVRYFRRNSIVYLLKKILKNERFSSTEFRWPNRRAKRNCSRRIQFVWRVQKRSKNVWEIYR